VVIQTIPSSLNSSATIFGKLMNLGFHRPEHVFQIDRSAAGRGPILKRRPRDEAWHGPPVGEDHI
jgi:hypothetical protein